MTYRENYTNIHLSKYEAGCLLNLVRNEINFLRKELKDQKSFSHHRENDILFFSRIGDMIHSQMECVEEYPTL
jgi:hypothetical protein